MRILVIGGSGTFIGARVVDELVRMGHDVAVFSRVAPRRGDVRHIAGIKGRDECYAPWGISRFSMQGFQRGGGGVPLGHDDGSDLVEITHWIPC